MLRTRPGQARPWLNGWKASASYSGVNEMAFGGHGYAELLWNSKASMQTKRFVWGLITRLHVGLFSNFPWGDSRKSSHARVEEM